MKKRTESISTLQASHEIHQMQRPATDIYIVVDCTAYCGICQRTVSVLDKYCRHCGAILLEVVER